MKLQTSLAIVSGFCLLWGQKQHGDFWWIVTDDYSYYEALQLHLRENGIWSAWGPTNISLYHWLTPAWVGQMSQVSFAADWSILNRVAPLVFSLSIVSTTFALLESLSSLRTSSIQSRVAILGGVFMILVLRIDFSGTSTFAVFTYAGTAILVASKLRVRRVQDWLLILFLLIATTFAKLFTLPTVTCIAVLLIAWRLLETNRYRIITVLALSLTLSLVFFGFLFWFGPILGNGSEPGWSVEIFAPRDLIRKLFLSGRALVPVLLSAIYLYSQFRKQQDNSRLLVLGIQSLSIYLISDFFIVPGMAINADDYFKLPALYFSLLAVISATHQIQNRKILIAASIGALVSFVVGSVPSPASRWINQVPPGIGNIVRLFDNHPLNVTLLIALIVTPFLVRIMNIKEEYSFVQCSLVALMLAISIQIVATRISDTFSSDYSRWSNRDSETVTQVLGSTDLVAVGRWIERNTPRQSLIATNDICAGIDTIEMQMNGSGILTCTSLGTDYTLAHTSSRRFLVLGPRFAYQNPELRDRYVAISLRFARRPDRVNLNQLTRIGTDYFVAYESDGNYVFSDSETIFRSGPYALVDLRQYRPTLETSSP